MPTDPARAIAIVGMACRFAGARDLHAYWDLTLAGRDGFGPIPADRWAHDAFYDASKRATDKSYCPVGGFVPDIRSFPALHFGIPPRRVEVMDPQQRLSIEVAVEAVEDAGYRTSELPRRTGVFVGVTANEFRQVLSSRILVRMMATGQLGTPPADADVLARVVEQVVPARPYSAPGVLANMIAAAVAQELDLHGPAYTVDAACASGLVAFADAVGQLRAGQVDAAIASGVYLQVTPENYVAFSRIGAMSPSGRCLPFDARADGFLQGEGGGALLLKRLEDAGRDGDRIYAVCHGIATNNDGRGDGPMAPVMAGQRQVIVDAWHDAAIDTRHLGYLETHGTGTEVGDATELEGLRQALAEAADGHAPDRVLLGSAKANVGHTMSAAGIAGLVRAVLAVHHGVVPPMAGFESAKPELGLDDRLAVPTVATPWKDPERFAGVSSFGFGGTNAHAVIGPAPTTSPPAADPGQPDLVCLSAPSEAELRTTAARLAAELRLHPSPVASVARSWAARPALTWRAAIVATSPAELVDALDAVAHGDAPKGGAVGEVWSEPPRVALLFPGQGAQRIGMLGALRDRFPVVRGAIDEAERDLDDLLALPLSWLLWPDRRPEAPLAGQAEAELLDTAHCQPALVATGLAGWRLLESVGVRPVAVAGHSLGEFAAAAAGGTLSNRDALRFAARRGRLMADVPGDPGAMAALRTDARGAEGLLVDGVVIANENHPRQIVVSGATEAVHEVVRRAGAADVEARTLPVSHAFHSPIFGNLDVGRLVDDLDIHEPDGVIVASCIAPQPYATAAEARAVFLRHAISPVRFQAALEQCLEAGADLFVQVGAGGPLASFARSGLGTRARAVLTLASTDDTDHGRSTLETLGWMWAYGVPLDRRVLLSHAATVANVPPIVLPREPYWPVKDEAQLALKLADVAAIGSHPAARNLPAVAEEHTPAATDEVFEQVAAVISRVSSYPRTAIRPDLGLVDALGFDSLMVADLATGLADAFPGLGGLPQELLLDKPTVQRIVDHVRGARSGGIAPTDDELPLGSWRPVWRPCVLPEVGPPADGSLAGRTVLVVGDPDPELTSVLKQAGASVTRRARTAVDLLVVATPFDAPVPVADVLAGRADQPDPAAVLLAALDEQVRWGGAPSVFVLRRADDVWAEAATGVVRALAREWPERMHKSLSFDEVDAPYRAARVVQELISSDRTPDVTWRADGSRFVLGQEPVASEPSWEPGPDDAVLVTGGTRGIGRRIAERLLAAGARVVVVGRGEQADLPAGATLIRADVTDRVALVAAAAPHLPFTAVVHCAGVLADGAAGKVDRDVGARARRTKIAGLLHAVVAAGPSVRAVLALGSWAGRFGSRHQTHYAAANAGMSGLADHLGVRAVVAETGPWVSSDMVRTIPAAVQAALRADGVDFVGDTPGLDALWNDLCGASGTVVHGRRVPWWNRVRIHEEILSTDSHPYLLDHAIDGVPVLPLAAATDLVAYAAGIPRPYEVADLRVYAGITVAEPVRIRVVTRGERVEIRAGERDTLSYRATVRPTEPPAIPEPSSATTALGTTLEAFYGGLTFHGPALRGLLAVDGADADSARGKVRTSRPTDWTPLTDREAWAVDPLALDSAFQLGALVAWDRYQRAGTPVSLRRLVVLEPWRGPLAVDVRFGAPKDDRFTASFVLRAPDGRVVAVAEDVVADLRTTDATPQLEIKPEWVDVAAWPEVRDLELRLEAAAAMGIENPYFHVHEGTAKNTTVVGGRTLVNFSSYNYVGLSGEPRVLAAVKDAVERYGTSVSASRVASGERPYHGALERALADAQGVDDAVVFTAGHMTNVNAIGTVMKPADLVLHDELAHDSLLQGIRLSGAKRRAYRHEDPEHLEKLLREIRGTAEKCLIVVEGVYSMDGDLCALPAFVELKKEYGCLLMVDEAHSFGVCGPTGRGIGEHYRATVDPRDIDLWMGTLSKSLASCGGWIGGNAKLIRYLRYSAGGFVFSAGLTPANGVAALTALELMLAEPWRVETLQSNARLFHEALTAHGLDTGPARGGSAVVPVVTGNSLHAMLLSQRLRAAGVNVQPIVYPAVADHAARLRFFLSSLHTDRELTETATLVAHTLGAVRAEFPA